MAWSVGTVFLWAAGQASPGCWAGRLVSGTLGLARRRPRRKRPPDTRHSSPMPMTSRPTLRPHCARRPRSCARRPRSCARRKILRPTLRPTPDPTHDPLPDAAPDGQDPAPDAAPDAQNPCPTMRPTHEPPPASAPDAQDAPARRSPRRMTPHLRLPAQRCARR